MQNVATMLSGGSPFTVFNNDDSNSSLEIIDSDSVERLQTTRSIDTIRIEPTYDTMPALLSLSSALKDRKGDIYLEFRLFHSLDLGSICFATCCPPHNTLLHLKFYKTHFSNCNAMTLSYMLELNCIVELAFTYCRFLDSAAATIASGLVRNTSLRTICVYYFRHKFPEEIDNLCAKVLEMIGVHNNEFVDVRLTLNSPRTWNIFNELTVRNQKLQTFYVHGCKMEPDQMEAVIAKCVNTPSLNHLGFAHCWIDDPVCTTLFKATMEHKILDTLCFQGMKTAPFNDGTRYMQLRHLVYDNCELLPRCFLFHPEGLVTTQTRSVLKKLSFVIDGDLRQVDFLTTAGEVLSRNSAILHLDLFFPTLIIFRAFAGSLINATNLRRISIHLKHLPQSEHDLLLESLQTLMTVNPHLMQVDLHALDIPHDFEERCRGVLHPPLLFRLDAFNKSTGLPFFDSPIWSNIIARDSQNTDIVFSLLREQPDIVSWFPKVNRKF